MVVDVVTELARYGVLSELQNADDLLLMSEMIEEQENVPKMDGGFESKCF